MFTRVSINNSALDITVKSVIWKISIVHTVMSKFLIKTAR